LVDSEIFDEGAWGSEYPHLDTWLRSLKMIDADFVGVRSR
jgi:hypothetical protein